MHPSSCLVLRLVLHPVLSCPVLCPLSSVLCPLSSVLCPLSSVLCPSSFVLCPSSCVLRPSSFVLCLLSPSRPVLSLLWLVGLVGWLVVCCVLLVVACCLWWWWFVCALVRLFTCLCVCVFCVGCWVLCAVPLCRCVVLRRVVSWRCLGVVVVVCCRGVVVCCWCSEVNVQDKPLRKYLPRVFSVIKKEWWDRRRSDTVVV